jgi:hypothetical protein
MARPATITLDKSGYRLQSSVTVGIRPVVMAVVSHAQIAATAHFIAAHAA